MNLNRQVQIIEKQIECFDALEQKMDYILHFFGPDPEFTQDAINIVTSNLINKGVT